MPPFHTPTQTTLPITPNPNYTEDPCNPYPTPHSSTPSTCPHTHRCGARSTRKSSSNASLATIACFVPWENGCVWIRCVARRAPPCANGCTTTSFPLPHVPLVPLVPPPQPANTNTHRAPNHGNGPAVEARVHCCCLCGAGNLSSNRLNLCLPNQPMPSAPSKHPETSAECKERVTSRVKPSNIWSHTLLPTGTRNRC